MFTESFAVGPLQCNCTILADEETREAVVVDPGGDFERIREVIEANALKVVGIVHTHAHIDHVGATAEVAELTGAPTFLHTEDSFLFEMLPQQAMMVGLPAVTQGTIDRALDDDVAISFGRHEIGVMHTPGHSPGSVCFAVPGQDLCLSGDTLFDGSIGRTDLWGGNFGQIERSIRDRLYTLNGSVRVVTGHGPDTTIDKERLTNPFVPAR